MSFSLSNRALLRGMLAGAAVITATACSRSDRTESGSDTSSAPAQSSSSTQPSRPAQPNSARAATAPPSDNGAAGYRAMERDTAEVPDQQVDSARVTADTAEVSDAAPDTSISVVPESSDTTAMDAMAEDTGATGYVEMARDTSTVTEQADTAAAVAVAEDDLANETADEQIVTSEDPEAVAAAVTQTEEVGAAAIGGDVTGTEAVALMSREGVRCALVDPEANEAARWDMSSTPVTLNPCGMGSMNLSRIRTEGGAGQD